MKLKEDGFQKIDSLEGAAKDLAMKIMDKWLLEGSISQSAAQWFKDMGVLEVGGKEVSLSKMEENLKAKSTAIYSFSGDERADKRNFWLMIADIKINFEAKNGKQGMVGLILPEKVLEMVSTSGNFQSTSDGSMPATMDFNGKIIEKAGELLKSEYVMYHSPDESMMFVDFGSVHVPIEVR